jgi:Cu(I)/Ag(I) efflux system membrane fusion protein
VFEHEARWLHPKDVVRVVYQGETFSAVVSDVLPIFDAEARTMKMRLDLPNPGYRFRPGMFVDVEFPVSLQSTLTVPADAVVDSGRRKTVFVDRGNGYFEPRQVETGWRLGDQVEILKGLMTGERIVIAGTFLIDSESRMKAAAAGLNPATVETDPICGMEVDPARAKAAGRTSVYKARRLTAPTTAEELRQGPAKVRRQVTPGKGWARAVALLAQRPIQCSRR